MNYKLFVYGTLMQPEILKRLINRIPDKKESRLNNFYFSKLHPYKAILPCNEEKEEHIDGILLEGLNTEEMRTIDIYEYVPFLYERIEVQLFDGTAAYTYIDGWGSKASEE